MIERANERIVEAPVGWAFGRVLDQAKRAWAGIAEVLTVNAKVRGALIVYEELSRLTDAEIDRRGIPRADLPRYILGLLHKR